MIPAIAALGCAFLFLCCQTAEDDDLKRQEIIENGVRIKVEEFSKLQMRKCRERAVKAAEARVDSLIREMARDEQINPIAKPPKKVKPERPQVRQLPDTLREELEQKKKGEQ
jgi:hypothetical protein